MDEPDLDPAIARAQLMRAVTKDAGDLARERASDARERCRRHRLRILEVARQVGAAHVAPAFSCVEIVDALYNRVMRPDDVFIMSKGHGCLAQYVVLEELDQLGAHLDSYCQPGGRLGAHPDYAPDLGIHASTGSLGHGLGIAAGQALAERIKGAASPARVFVLLSDGECQEGSTWEAAMVAANLRLDNLVALVDANDWGGMERMSEAFPTLNGSESSLAAKFTAFGWAAWNAYDGHDCAREISGAARYKSPKPRALVCYTAKGKGVSFIEQGQPLWHYRSPNDAEYEQAVREIMEGGA